MNLANQNRSSQWALLALLRFVLALIVLLVHVGTVIGHNEERILNFGSWTAVMAFFVISGYSIASSVSQRPYDFFHRRFFRIYPCCLLAIFLAAIAILLRDHVTHSHSHISRATWISAFIMTGDFFAPKLYDLGSYWSLKYEVVFYAFAKLIDALPEKVMYGFIAVSFFFFSQSPTIAQENYPRTFFVWRILTVLWLWLLGFVLYKAPKLSWTAVLTPLALSFVYRADRAEYAVPLIFITVFALKFGDLVHVPSLGRKVMNWLGGLSYPLYILHFPILFILLSLPARYRPISVLIFVPIAVSIAALHIWDYPIRRLASRWSSQDRAAPGSLHPQDVSDVSKS